MKLIHGKNKGKNPLPIRPMVVGVASRTKSWEWKPSSQAAPGQHPGWSADPLVLDGYAVPPSPSILQSLSIRPKRQTETSEDWLSF